MKHPTRIIGALAQALSWALHPLVFPIYLVLLLFSQTAFAHFPSAVKWYLAGSVLLYGVLLPVFAICVLRYRGYLPDWKIGERSQRITPLLIGTCCYVLCAVTIGRIDSALFLRKFMIASACCELMCALVTTRWQISLHLTGMGAAVALLVVMNLLALPGMFMPLLWGVAATGLLASARLYLGRHNPWQVLAGFVGGFAITITAIFFF